MNTPSLIPSIERLEELAREERLAHLRLTNACEVRWPEGTHVKIILGSRQKKPTQGTIVKFCGGEATVQLDALNGWGFHTVKRVHYTKIVEGK